MTLAAIAADRAAHGELIFMVMPRLLVPQARDLVADFGGVSTQFTRRLQTLGLPWAKKLRHGPSPVL